MLARFIPGPFVGVLSMLMYTLNTLFWFMPIMALSFLKLLPIKIWRTLVSYIIDSCAVAWISINNLHQKFTGGTRFIVSGLDKLTKRDWYLVMANHQSWVDILVLQRIFNRKIPFLKFFLKKELIYVPFLGLAWWALDFPFMQRYSKSFIKKNPHLKGKDIETTRKACAKFQHKPVSIMNFVEGTRFTNKKHSQQDSQFEYLLKPKSGGIAFVLEAMGDQLHKLLDVTIYYPKGIPTFWDFICGKVKEVQIKINVLPIDEKLVGDYFNDVRFRQTFHHWLNEIWQNKDTTLTQMARSK